MDNLRDDSLKEKILSLRALGYTYDKIKEELNCSKATISYYCSIDGKEKVLERTRKLREDPVYAKTQAYKYVHKGIRNKYDKFNSSDGTIENCDFNMYDVKKILDDNPVCYLTGRPIDPSNPNTFHFDHKIPVSKGGINSIENLGIASRDANLAKHDMNLDDFLDLCYDILKHHGRI